MSATRANAARRFFADAINEYGIREGDRVRIPMRQCELARRSNVASSTVGAYLSAMGETVVARHPEIIIDLEQTSPDGDDCSEPAPAPQSLLAVIAELLEVQARLVRAVGLLPATAAARDPREPRGSARSSRGFEVVEAVKQEEEPYFSPSCPEVRDESARNRAEPRGSTTTTAATGDDENLEVVLRPLHELARRRSLMPMNNRGGVVAALEPYTCDEVGNAVERIVALCEAQRSPVRSPFGLLVGWARSGDRERFMPAVTSPEAPNGGREEPVADGPFDAVVTAEIASMEADPKAFAEELRWLDEQIARDHPHGRHRHPHRLRLRHRHQHQHQHQTECRHRTSRCRPATSRTPPHRARRRGLRWRSCPPHRSPPRFAPPAARHRCPGRSPGRRRSR